MPPRKRFHISDNLGFQLVGEAGAKTDELMMVENSLDQNFSVIVLMWLIAVMKHLVYRLQSVNKGSQGRNSRQ